MKHWFRRTFYTVSLTHGAEPFLRSCQLCSYSRTSQYFMEPEGSLPCSQEPTTGPHPEPDQSNPYHPILSKIHFNIVHLPTSWSSRWSLSFCLFYTVCVRICCGMSVESRDSLISRDSHCEVIAASAVSSLETDSLEAVANSRPWRRRGRRSSPHCCKPLRGNVESYEIDARQRGQEP
jgi:hypothetical protein